MLLEVACIVWEKQKEQFPLLAATSADLPDNNSSVAVKIPRSAHGQGACSPTCAVFSNIEPFDESFLAPTGALYVSMCHFRSSLTLLFSLIPTPQCHNSRSKSLKHHQRSSQNKYHILERTHVPRRPCFNVAGLGEKFDKREVLYHLYLQPIRSATNCQKFYIKMRNLKVLKSGCSFKVLECQILLGKILRPFLISLKSSSHTAKQADLSKIF